MLLQKPKKLSKLVLIQNVTMIVIIYKMATAVIFLSSNVLQGCRHPSRENFSGRLEIQYIIRQYSTITVPNISVVQVKILLGYSTHKVLSGTPLYSPNIALLVRKVTITPAGKNYIKSCLKFSTLKVPSSTTLVLSLFPRYQGKTLQKCSSLSREKFFSRSQIQVQFSFHLVPSSTAPIFDFTRYISKKTFQPVFL